MEPTAGVLANHRATPAPVYLGSGEKHHKSVGFRDVISIKSLLFFRTLTYLIRYVRVPVDLVPNVPRGVKVYRDVNVPNVPYKVRYELYSLL